MPSNASTFILLYVTTQIICASFHSLLITLSTYSTHLFQSSLDSRCTLSYFNPMVLSKCFKLSKTFMCCCLFVCFCTSSCVFFNSFQVCFVVPVLHVRHLSQCISSQCAFRPVFTQPHYHLVPGIFSYCLFMLLNSHLLI